MEAGVAGRNQDPLAYTGTQYNYVPCAWFPRDPTTADVNYPFMFIWGNQSSGSMWIRTNSAAVWIEINSGAGIQPVPQGGTGRASLTNHGLVVGASASAVNFAGPAAAGTILQGAGASADPAFSTATYPATTTIDQILYSSAANTVSGLATANNGMLVTSATGVPSILAGPGTTGNMLQSNAAAAPSFSTATYPSTTAQGDILVSSAANTVTSLAKSATATRYVANTGALNEPQWDQVNLTNGVTGTLPIANGGTGLGGSEGTVQTTDATPANALTVALGATPLTYMVTAFVSAYASVGVGTPLGAGFMVQGVVRTDGATATLVAQTPTAYQEGALAATAAVLAVSANNALITVTGVAAYTISWKVEAIFVTQGV